MKKVFALLMILSLGIILVSCSSECTYKFVDDDGTVLLEAKGKKGSEIKLPTNPTKESTAEFTYEFIGWDKEVGVLEENTVFTAQYKETKRKYTYKFVNYDESILKEETVEYGVLPVAPTAPTKPSTSEYAYEFTGWDKEIKEATEDTVYTALFKETKRKYTCKFVNYDGTVLKEETVEYGVLPVAPTAPTKPSTSEYAYEFTGWDKEIKEATEDTVYTALFKETKRKYTCKFVNYDGTVLKEETVEYGVLPVAPTAPTKPSTSEYAYEFTGWDKEIKEATEDIVYTALFKETKRKYTYKFVNFDKTILKEETVEYGTKPVAPSNPTREDDLKATYTFNGWDKELKEVTEDVIYTATYTAQVKDFKYSELVGKKISILGDSISTFYSANSSMNSYYSQEGRYYYPTYCPDVKTVDKTWWAQLITNTNMVLGINNSWSGSTAVGTGESAGCSDARINTLIENGEPDIIIIYLGTNDVCSGYTPEAFIEAYETIIAKISKLCIAQVYVCTLGYSAFTGMQYTDTNRVAYNKAIREFASKHNLGVIPLDEYIMEDNYNLYLSDNLHYKYAGTKLISQICEKTLCEFNNIEYTKEVEVEHPVPLPTGYIKVVSYNSGVWSDSVYSKGALLYSYDALDRDSAYIYYYIVEITKDGDNYKVTGKKDLNVTCAFEECDYFIMIFSQNPYLDFYSDVNVGDYLKLTGDITSGNCEFTLIK